MTEIEFGEILKDKERTTHLNFGVGVTVILSNEDVDDIYNSLKQISEINSTKSAEIVEKT